MEEGQQLHISVRKKLMALVKKITDSPWFIFLTLSIGLVIIIAFIAYIIITYHTSMK